MPDLYNRKKPDLYLYVGQAYSWCLDRPPINFTENLHDDSWRGSLTDDRLQRYLPYVDIDSIGGPGNVTPLAAACWKGHLDVVTVLLTNPYRSANPNARSPYDRTALFFATTRSPPANRVAIVRLLLKAGADPDACSEDDGLNTPLMNAITKVQDKDVVRELLDHGASMSRRNEEGETAEMLAKGTPLAEMLGGKNKLNSTVLAAVIDVIISVVILIAVYMNNTQMKGIVETIANKLHEAAGTREWEPEAAGSTREWKPASEATGTRKWEPKPAAAKQADDAANLPQIQNLQDMIDSDRQTASSIDTPREQALTPEPKETSNHRMTPTQGVPHAKEAVYGRKEPPPAQRNAQDLLKSPTSTPPTPQSVPRVRSTGYDQKDMVPSTQRPTHGSSQPSTSRSNSALDNRAASSADTKTPSSDFEGSKTPQEILATLDVSIRELNLKTFFEPGDRFLHTLAENAAALRGDLTTSLGSSENIKRLTRLSLYQLVIYCSDGASMGIDNRYIDQCEIVKRIARIATKLVPDNFGVDLRFINSRNTPNVQAVHVETVLKRVGPAGNANLGTGLKKKILKPLVYDVITNSRPFERPLLVCVIVDSNPSPEAPSTFRDSIVECRRRLIKADYQPTDVVFNIGQIGDDAEARGFLRELQRERGIEDVLFCTTDRLDEGFKELRDNERALDEWLLRFITAPIMGRHVA